jgi:hypothetical protein
MASTPLGLTVTPSGACAERSRSIEGLFLITGKKMDIQILKY